MLLTTAYFPPVPWFSAVAAACTLPDGRMAPAAVYLDACERYRKQSWRNRCRILAANGPETLIVPVLHEGGTCARPIREVRVDYRTPWVVRTCRALDSAYRSAAYYAHYREDVFALLEARPDTLWELDLSLIRIFLEKTGIPARLRLSDSCPPAGDERFGTDLRRAFHPKHPVPESVRVQRGKPYFQVFSGKYGFQPDLSVMDLLFNEGPGSISYLLP